MKEGISYSFLLNIIILFIFVCAAIITGVFSYYRAFRAGTMIVNEIEKFEGFNCVSAESISKKMGSVSYNLPFNVKCKDGETNCVTDEGHNYKIYSYNLDASSSKPSSVEKIKIGDSSYDGASSVSCSDNICKMSSKYQYGVYTYMYIDLPIVSGLVRIPVYNKTKIMIDQRDLLSISTSDVSGNKESYVIDKDVLPLEYTGKKGNYVDDIRYFAINKVFVNYNERKDGNEYYNQELKKYGYGVRITYDYLGSKSNIREWFKLSDASLENAQSLQKTLKKKCGTVVDWSLF